MATQQESDYQYVITHTTWKGIQMFSLLSPPLLLLNAARKRNFRAATFLRKSAVWTWGGGAAVGAGLGWGRMRNMESEGVSDRAARLRANVGQVRTDDYGKIGSVVGALATAGLTYGRASLLSSIPGGAALGVAGGVLTHIAQSVAQKDSLSPEMMVQEAKEVAPLKKTVREVEEGKGKEVAEGK